MARTTCSPSGVVSAQMAVCSEMQRLLLPEQAAGTRKPTAGGDEPYYLPKSAITCTLIPLRGTRTLFIASKDILCLDYIDICGRVCRPRGILVATTSAEALHVANLPSAKVNEKVTVTTVRDCEYDAGTAWNLLSPTYHPPAVLMTRIIYMPRIVLAVSLPLESIPSICLTTVRYGTWNEYSYEYSTLYCTAYASLFRQGI